MHFIIKSQCSEGVAYYNGSHRWTALIERARCYATLATARRTLRRVKAEAGFYAPYAFIVQV